MEKENNLTRGEILEALKKVIDPEVGVSIVDLGLIYDIAIDEKIHIKMTLTTPTCPLGPMIVSAVKFRIKEVFGKEAEVKVVFDPLWSPKMMSEKAKEILGYEGEQNA